MWADALSKAEAAARAMIVAARTIRNLFSIIVLLSMRLHPNEIRRQRRD
jgi:hypothetical protein